MRRRLALAVLFAGLAAAGVLAATGGTTGTATTWECVGSEVVLFDNSNGGVIKNGGAPPSFGTHDKPYCLTYLEHYHWNSGKGAAPGTIGLSQTSGPSGFGKIVGPFKAKGSSGQDNAQNVNWYAYVSKDPPTVIQGTYMCTDSGSATWSSTGGGAFCIVKGVPAVAKSGGVTTTKPPTTTTTPDATPSKPDIRVDLRTTESLDPKYERAMSWKIMNPLHAGSFRPNWIDYHPDRLRLEVRVHNKGPGAVTGLRFGVSFSGAGSIGVTPAVEYVHARGSDSEGVECNPSSGAAMHRLTCTKASLAAQHSVVLVLYLNFDKDPTPEMLAFLHGKLVIVKADGRVNEAERDGPFAKDENNRDTLNFRIFEGAPPLNDPPPIIGGKG